MPREPRNPCAVTAHCHYFTHCHNKSQKIGTQPWTHAPPHETTGEAEGKWTLTREISYVKWKPPPSHHHRTTMLVSAIHMTKQRFWTPQCHTHHRSYKRSIIRPDENLCPFTTSRKRNHHPREAPPPSIRFENLEATESEPSWDELRGSQCHTKDATATWGKFREENTFFVKCFFFLLFVNCFFVYFVCLPSLLY